MALPEFDATGIETVPLIKIDYRKLVDGDVEECKRLFTASTELGFFYLENNELNPTPIFDLAEHFYADTSVEERLKYDMGTAGMR